MFKLRVMKEFPVSEKRFIHFKGNSKQKFNSQGLIFFPIGSLARERNGCRIIAAETARGGRKCASVGFRLSIL